MESQGGGEGQNRRGRGRVDWRERRVRSGGWHCCFIAVTLMCHLSTAG